MKLFNSVIRLPSAWFYLDIESAAVRLHLCWSFESNFNKGRENDRGKEDI